MAFVQKQLAPDTRLLTDLASLCKLRGFLSAIIEETTSIAPQLIDSETIAADVGRKVGVSKEDAGKAISIIYNLLALREDFGSPFDSLFNDLDLAFARMKLDAEATQHLASWQSSRSEVLAILTEIKPDHAIRTARKIDRILASQQNTLSESRIITEMRPVYADEGLDVLHNVIIHKLLVQYLDGPRRSEIEFVLDAQDLSGLRKACELAEARAVSLKETMKILPWRTSIAQASEET